LRHKEVFVPLAHPPGDGQADFGEALVAIGGVEQKAHFLCVDLPPSDEAFVAAFPAENTEAFLEGHSQAFAYLGGVPRTMLYDNTTIAVKEIAGDGERKPIEEFSRLQSHYLFEAKFGRPGIWQALSLRAISFDAVKHLVLCAIEQRPPKLDLENYPHLPVARVALTAAGGR
jgi:transposase